MYFKFNLKKEDFLFYAKYSCINSELLISLYTINLIKISIYFIKNDLKNELFILKKVNSSKYFW